MAKDQHLTAEDLRLAAKALEREEGQYILFLFTSLESVMEKYGDRLLELARHTMATGKETRI